MMRNIIAYFHARRPRYIYIRSVSLRDEKLCKINRGVLLSAEDKFINDASFIYSYVIPLSLYRPQTCKNTSANVI